MENIDKEINFIKEQVIEETDIYMQNLFTNLVAITPVKTGALRNAWEGPTKQILRDDLINYKFFNGQDYADTILIRGIHYINGKRYGSEQLPDGILPYIKSYLKKHKLDSKIKVEKN